MNLKRLALPTWPILLASLTSADVLHVDQSVATSGDGAHWASAIKQLDAAIAVAKTNPAIDAIWVAEGTYRPGVARSDSFEMLPGVEYLGGFPAGGSGLALRDPHAHPTLLSGNIGLFSTPTDNAYHVVTAVYADGASLDGFKIADGRANDSTVYGHSIGGALYVFASDVTVTDCTFVDNWALAGGAIALRQESGLSVTRCDFHDNIASFSDGGAIFDRSGLDVATPSGVLVDRCVFRDNGASSYGGAISTGSPLWVYSSVFNDNTSGGYGGAIALPSTISSSQALAVSGCTFVNNTADDGGAIAKLSAAQMVVANSILWSNSGGVTPALFDAVPSTSAVTYNDLTCCFVGGSNISHDPQFLDADGADDVAGTADDDLRLALGSPCRDAGSNTLHPSWQELDVLDHARIRNGNLTPGASIDLGAYEATFKLHRIQPK